MSKIFERTKELLKEYDFKLYEIDGSLEEGSILIKINKGYFNISIQLETSDYTEIDCIQSWIEVEDSELDIYENSIMDLTVEDLEQEFHDLSEIYSEKFNEIKKLNKLIISLNELDLPIDFIKSYIDEKCEGNE